MQWLPLAIVGSLLPASAIVGSPTQGKGGGAGGRAGEARSRSYWRSHLRIALSDTPYRRPTAEKLVSAISRRSWS